MELQGSHGQQHWPRQPSDVQQYGQPPAEIIKELAPGLEFNAEGMPIMPGLGPTTMPSDLPGMPGIPFPETTPDGQPCSIM